MALRVGLLGAGFIAGVHVDAYAKLQGATVTAVADVNTEAASALAGKCGGANVYSNPDDLIADESIDVVDVCLPTFLHEKYVVAAARAGKHILCEKPIALNLEQAERMVEATGKAGVMFMVAHVVRFWPEYLAAKQVIDSGELGRPVEVAAARLSTTPVWSADNWILKPELSGGAALDLHIHDLDYVNWVLGKPMSVFARGLKSEKGALDHIVTMISYEAGGTANVEGGWMMPEDFPFTTILRIVCEKGCVDFQARAGVNIEAREAAKPALAVHKRGEKVRYPEVPSRDAYLAEIEYFIKCIETNTPPSMVTPQDAVTALKVALAARTSVETGAVVNV
ncbi:MAG: Gfo/Idh/MocA family oxidoreductase [Firmicutes bacterium]|nr:Gfo/Idh/MocA family oxidoreductase [Bacillota bacterium]